jgi:ATP-dependent DNA helicase RecG
LSEIGEIKFIGPQRKKLLLKLGVENSNDLLYLFPRTYEARTVFKKIIDILPGESACVVATVGRELKQSRIRGSLSISKGEIFDETSNMEITFFNQNFIKARLKVGQTFIFYGKTGGNLVKKEFINPDIEEYSQDKEKFGRILPIYPLVAD